MDILEDLVRRYRLLVLGHGGRIMPVFAYPWEAIFREAWMPR